MKELRPEDTNNDRAISYLSVDSWKELNDMAPITAFQDKKSKTKDETEAYKNITLNHITNSFIDNVGMQGVRYLFLRNAAWHRRFIWLIILLSALAYANYISVNNILDYMTHPTTTKAEIHFQKKMPFPAVTFCNYNIFQSSKLSLAEQRFIRQIYSPYRSWAMSTDENDTRGDNIDIDGLFKKGAFDYLERMGICEFQKQPCNRSLFYTAVRDVGTCLTFDPTKNPKKMYQTIPGRTGSLVLTFDTSGDEWSPGPYMNLDGFVVLVHDPEDELVLVNDNGFSIPIGEMGTIMVSHKKVQLLPPPHGQCGSKDLKYYRKYTKVQCEMECYLRTLRDICGCKAEYLPAESGVRTCDQRELEDCEFAIIEDDSMLDEHFSECDCPPECEKLVYDVKMSTAKVTDGFRAMIMASFDDFDVEENGIEIRVYYPSLHYVSEIQEATYSFEKLLCDVGGAAGLFLGASFLTLAELFDFVGQAVYMTAAKRRRPNDIIVLP